MKRSEVIEFFGGVRAAARALGLGSATVSQWKEEVPVSRQQHVELAMEAEKKRREKGEFKKEPKKTKKSLSEVADKAIKAARKARSVA